MKCCPWILLLFARTAASASTILQRPVIVNQGSVDVGSLCEQTPLVIDGELYRYESVHSAYHGSLTPGHNYQRFVHVKTGNVTPPFGSGYALGSAFATHDAVYAYGTFCDTTDNCGAPTSNQEIRVFWSTDKMQTWQSRTVIDARGKKYTLWNTSVTKAKINGTDCFIMAFEVRDAETPGGWNTLFATAPDPAGPWSVLDTEVYRMPLNVEHADPTIRFVPDADDDNSEAGWFYVITGRASLATACTDSSPRFFTEIYRSRDLQIWQASPGMGTPSAIDGMIKPNAAADKQPAGRVLSPSEAEYMEKHKNETDSWVDCNSSDLDLCEVDGQTVMFWTWGHQGTNGGLVRGVSPMKLTAFLEQWFIEPLTMI